MKSPLKPEELYKCCDPKIFDFETTDELTPVEGPLGQEMAINAIEFGLSLENTGFNIFVLGEHGTGKFTSVRELIKKKAETEPVPSDWCYVYNFKNPDAPMAISFPPGIAVQFQKDMSDLIKTLRAEIPKIFESKEYEKQRNRIVEEFQKKQKELFTSIEEEASSNGFAIRKSVSGLLIVPVKKSGEALTEEEFETLDDKTKKKIEEIGKSLQEKLDDVVRAVKEAEKLLKDMLQKLEKTAALGAVGHLIDELKGKYRDNQKAIEYLENVKEDILDHLDDFKAQEEQTPPLPFMRIPRQEPIFTRYEVNVIVDNRDLKGAPCVFEHNPTYYNLFGRIEHKFQYGIAVTDFSMIKAGSLHKANGGYIVIHALDILRNLFSYDAIKRAIRNNEIKIEDIWEQYRLISTTTLKPQPIPLNVKVILIGHPYIYYILYNYDEEFKELFKVKADFDSRMDKNEETIKKYAMFIASRCKAENLLPFDRTGVASVVEYGSRLAVHQEKLSALFGHLADILREASFWAKKSDSPVVKAEHVEKAISERRFRHNRIEERLREAVLEDTIIVETSGKKIGQINGLAVIDLGDYSFGKPSRITARTYIGKAGVINIERETKMSGRIHEKAILILTNYLGSRYAIKRPISLSASITFEQLYEMVEGDSATCAEFYALISSIAGIPLKQSIAVTGSMDQNGEVQPIGGVNEKIEGFFDVCKERGMDGSHGVIIPKRNLKHLMLRKDVVNAVKEGKFSIYPIERVEEGLEILTDMPAGELRDDGTYPEGTINYLVMKRLTEISEALKEKKEEKDNLNESKRS